MTKAASTSVWGLAFSTKLSAALIAISETPPLDSRATLCNWNKVAFTKSLLDVLSAALSRAHHWPPSPEGLQGLDRSALIRRSRTRTGGALESARVRYRPGG